MTVGVIGAGQWGRNLVQTFHTLGHLAGVAEINLERRNDLAVRYPGVPVYTDYRDLLKADFPAVVIATPASTHYLLAREALEMGKDVFVEKPFTLCGVEAGELAALARRHSRILMVGHLLIYQPAVQWIKQYLDMGSLGKLSVFSFERLKLGRVRRSENVLWSLGVHDVAVLLFLVGAKPLSVKAAGQCILQGGIEDECYVHLCFSGNITAHLHVSWLWPEQRRRLTIIGSEAMLTYDELTQEITLHKKGVTAGLENRDEGGEVIRWSKEEPLALECAHFLECVATRQKPLTDGEGALEVLKVLEQVGHSL